jgi:hypothetical protein
LVFQGAALCARSADSAALGGHCNAAVGKIHKKGFLLAAKSCII